MKKIQKNKFFLLLKEKEDLAYKAFNQKLIPSVPEEQIIGVRVPVLRALAKKLMKEQPEESMYFLEKQPHYYLEERHLHGFLIEQLKEKDLVFKETERFLPYIDNWQTCDLFYPKLWDFYTDELLLKIRVWLDSELCYTVRYGIGLLLRCYLKEHFEKEQLWWVQNIVSNEYYVNMMRAWYFSMALVHQYDSAICFLTEKQLDLWTHNKTIQKARESRQISSETKDFLRSLRIKQ